MNVSVQQGVNPRDRQETLGQTKEPSCVGLGHHQDTRQDDRAARRKAKKVFAKHESWHN